MERKRKKKRKREKKRNEKKFPPFMKSAPSLLPS
jgi:hypothetical protein